jgi:hypothetical protein
METVVELVGEFLTRDTHRGKQVRSSDIANEQRVAGQYRMRFGIVRVFPHHDADRLRRVARCVADLENDE